MSTTAPLGAFELLRLIHNSLKGFVENGRKGLISVARDPAEIMELLGQAPGRFRCILSWGGEQSVGHKSSGIVEHTILVTLSHNRGLSLIRGENMFLRATGEPPLVELSGQVRMLMHSLRFPNEITEITLAYGGTEPVAVDGTPIDALTQTWRLKASLPAATIVEGTPAGQPIDFGGGIAVELA